MDGLTNFWKLSFANRRYRILLHSCFWIFLLFFWLRENLIIHIDIAQKIATNVSGIFLALFLFYPLVYGIFPLLKKRRFVLFALLFIAWYAIGAGLRYYHINLLVNMHKSEGEGWLSGQDFLNSLYDNRLQPYELVGVFFSGIAGFLTIIIIPLTCKFIRYAYTINYNQALLQKEKTELELEFLKSQINPHLFFNTLNNLQSFIIHGEKDNSLKLLNSFADFMRYALYECNSQYIAIEKEAELIAHYLAIEKVRYPDKAYINYTFQLLNNEFKIPPLVLLTLVENAFKHSNNLPEKSIAIDIDLECNNNTLHFTVRNHYQKQDIKDKSTGIGLINLKKRLRHYFADKYELLLENDGYIFTARLIIFAV